MKVWIDPPSGWRYGFPKVYDGSRDGEIYTWLVEQGYPQSEIDSLGTQFYWRSWAVADQTKEFNQGIATKKG